MTNPILANARKVVPVQAIKKPELKPTINKGELLSIFSGCALAEAAADLAKVLKFPTDTAIVVALGVASMPVSMVFRSQYKSGGRIPLGIYVACEQPPSTSKSGIIGALLAPIHEGTKAIKEQNGGYAGVVTDATQEALEGTLASSGGHFIVAGSEQNTITSLFGLSYGKDKGASNNNGLILEGYSGDWHSSLRVTRAGYMGYVSGAVTVISQRGTIDKILSTSNGTGIAERFIMLSEPDLLGFRDHLLEHHADKPLKQSYAQAIGELYNLAVRGMNAKSAAIAAANPDTPSEDLPITMRELGELDCLHVTAASWDYINQQKNILEAKMGAGGDFESDLMRSYAGKLDQRVVKVAGVLHVMEHLMKGEDVPGNIAHRYIEQATAFAWWGIDRFYASAMEKGHIGRPADQDAVLNFIIKHRCPSMRQIQQGLKGLAAFKGARKGAALAIKATISELLDQQLILAVHENLKVSESDTGQQVTKVKTTYTLAE